MQKYIQASFISILLLLSSVSVAQIQPGSIVKISDNSGAQEVKIIGDVDFNVGDIDFNVGDIVIAKATKTKPGKIKKGEEVRVLIIRTKKALKRKDGSSVKFHEDSGVIINHKNQLIGTRVFGPVPKELREKGHVKLTILASEVL